MDDRKWNLVTGGTGFIGFALVKRLISSGNSVRVITRGKNFHKEFEYLRSKSTKSQMEIYTADITNKDDIRGAFVNVSYVFHVAALVNIHSAKPYSEFEAANVTSTKNICDLSLEYNVKKLFYFSTCDVFGLPNKEQVFTESSPYRPWSEPYADTKIQASLIVKAFQHQGLNSTILYPGWVYGPGDKAFLPSLLEQMETGVIPVWDSDKNQLCLVYIDDFIDAVFLAIENDKSDNEDFLILNDGSGVCLKSLYNKIGNIFNLKYKVIQIPYRIAFAFAWISELLSRLRIVKTPMLTTSDVKALGKEFKYSANKANSLLGWYSKEDIYSGILKWKSWHETL
jgi:2-alkyl-3-oxoalkanoate reductase